MQLSLFSCIKIDKDKLIAIEHFLFLACSQRDIDLEEFVGGTRERNP